MLQNEYLYIYIYNAMKKMDGENYSEEKENVEKTNAFDKL